LASARHWRPLFEENRVDHARDLGLEHHRVGRVELSHELHHVAHVLRLHDHGLDGGRLLAASLLGVALGVRARHGERAHAERERTSSARAERTRRGWEAEHL
jgi:hypothetical protein